MEPFQLDRNPEWLSAPSNVGTRHRGAILCMMARAKQVFPKVAAGFGSKNLLDKGS